MLDIPIVTRDPKYTPVKAHPGDAGYDLFACLDEDIKIRPGARALIPVGFRLALPPCYEAQIRSRSGLALKHGVFVLNSPGTVDSGYRGEVGVILHNTGSKSFKVHDGDRIAQMVITLLPLVQLDLRTILPDSDRGEDGFGSTGV